MNRYVISDTHFKHRNIVRGCSSWDDKSGCRDFDTLAQHDDTQINNWNSLVTNDDVVWHLGDFCFGHEAEDAARYLRRLNFKELNFISGNHDKAMHKFFNFKDRQDIDGRGVFRCGSYIETVVDGYDFVLCHYPILRWNGCHHGTIMLFGHEHGHINNLVDKLFPNGRIMDVGSENINFTPISFSQIIYKMKDRGSVPHHNDI